MPIDVTCAKCLTRFQVSEKFAGRSGPCPKCKTVIKVPEVQEVKIHAPEPSGPKDSKGEVILNPILRKEPKVTTLMIVAISLGVLVTLIAALVIGNSAAKPGQISPLILAIGSVLLAPPLAMAGYAILRDDELEPHRGLTLLKRVIAPSIVYPLLWALYWFIFARIDIVPELPWLVVVVPLVIAAGTITANASLDLEFGTAALHYGMYLTATVLLRLLMGMNAFWQVYS